MTVCGSKDGALTSECLTAQVFVLVTLTSWHNCPF